jgi:hypothetical protein
MRRSVHGAEEAYTESDRLEALVREFSINARDLASRLGKKVEELQNENARLRIVQVERVATDEVDDTDVAAERLQNGCGPSLKAEVPPPLAIESNDFQLHDVPEESASQGSSTGGRKFQALTAKQARAAMQKIDKSPHLGIPGETEAKKPKGKKRLFTDVDEMKTQVRTAILQPYNVSVYYNHDSVFAKIAEHNAFELSTLGAVMLNCVWMSIDIDWNGDKDTQDKHIVAQIIEYSFFAFFLGEILIRFAAFRRKADCVRDFWFNFDAVLVTLMILDTTLPLVTSDGLGVNTGIMRLARLIKVTRMARMARLLTRWPELGVLLKGLGIACRSVTSTIALLLILVYVFAVAFRYITFDTKVGNKYFRNVPIGMKFLTLYATMPDTIKFVEDAGAEHFLIGILVVLFVMCSSLTLLNMLIGVLCEVIGVVSALEKEESRIHVVKDQLIQVLRVSGIDANKDGLISKGEFQTMLLNPSVVRVMRDVGVDPVGLIDFIDYIFCGDFEDERGLTFDKLVELICELGGSNTATVKDVVDMRQVVIRQLSLVEDILDKHSEYLEKHQSDIGAAIHISHKAYEARESTSTSVGSRLKSPPLPEDLHYETAKVEIII